MRRYCFLLPCGKVGSGHVTTDGYVALMRSSCLVGRWGLGTRLLMVMLFLCTLLALWEGGVWARDY